MRACWLKWVGRDWSISADYIWLNYPDANSSKEGLRVLLSCATHRMCAVNDFSFALLSLFEKPITKNEVRDILKKEGLSANEEQLNKLVDNCMKADILQLIR